MNDEERNKLCSLVCKQIENIQDEFCFFFYKLRKFIPYQELYKLYFHDQTARITTSLMMLQKYYNLFNLIRLLIYFNVSYDTSMLDGCFEEIMKNDQSFFVEIHQSLFQSRSFPATFFEFISPLIVKTHVQEEQYVNQILYYLYFFMHHCTTTENGSQPLEQDSLLSSVCSFNNEKQLVDPSLVLLAHCLHSLENHHPLSSLSDLLKFIERSQFVVPQALYQRIQHQLLDSQHYSLVSSFVFFSSPGYFITSTTPSITSSDLPLLLYTYLQDHLQPLHQSKPSNPLALYPFYDANTEIVVHLALYNRQLSICLSSLRQIHNQTLKNTLFSTVILPYLRDHHQLSSLKLVYLNYMEQSLLYTFVEQNHLFEEIMPYILHNHLYNYQKYLTYFHSQNIHKYDQRLLYNKLYNCSPSMAKHLSQMPLQPSSEEFNEQALHNSKYKSLHQCESIDAPFDIESYVPGSFMKGTSH